MTVDWTLRFKSPAAPNKGVTDVGIQSNSYDYAKAKEVADDYLMREMAHPATKFISLAPTIGHSEDRMMALRAGQADPWADATPEGARARALAEAEQAEAAKAEAIPADIPVDPELDDMAGRPVTQRATLRKPPVQTAPEGASTPQHVGKAVRARVGE